MMVPALFFAVTILECGPAPLEHGLVCGLAHVGLGPRQCAATTLLPYAAPVGMELVSRTPGDGVRACEVATVAKNFISGILMVFEWSAAMVLVSVGHILMNNGDVLWSPYPCLCCDDEETACSSCDCGDLCDDDSCSPICSFQALNLLVVTACVYVCSSCVCVFLLGEDSSSQDSSIAALHLLVVAAFSLLSCAFSPSCSWPCAWPVPFRNAKEPSSKVCGKIAKVKRNPFVSRPEKIGAQASSSIQAESFIALESAELVKERQESSIDISWDDVRDAVVTESPEYQCAAAAFEDTSSFVHSGPWEAQHKVQPVQFFVKGKVSMSTSVVRGCLEEVLSQVVGTDGLDVCAMMNGKMLDSRSTLRHCGITNDCTVHIRYRLRGGSREDVPGQWTCSQCFAPRCWPVRKRFYRCGAARDDLPVSSKGKGKGKRDVAVGPHGRKTPSTAGNVPPTTRKPQVVPPRGPPGEGVGTFSNSCNATFSSI